MVDSETLDRHRVRQWVIQLGATARELDAIHHRTARTGPDVWGLVPQNVDDFRLSFDENVREVAETCRSWVRQLAAEAGFPVPCMTSEPPPPTPKFYDPNKRVELGEATDARQLIPGDPEALFSLARDLERFPEILQEVDDLSRQIRAVQN